MPDGIVKKYIHKNNNFHTDKLENINLPKNVCAVKSITFKPIDLMQICFWIPSKCLAKKNSYKFDQKKKFLQIILKWIYFSKITIR